MPSDLFKITADLKIGLLKGKAYLRNLVLRKDALDFLDLPIVIRAGFVVRLLHADH